MKTFKEYTLITFSMLLVSFAVYFFLGPSHVIVGSIAGLCFVLNKLFLLPISILSLILNGILLIIGILLIGKEFGTKTIYTTILLSLFLALFEKWFPDPSSITNNSIYDLVLYIIIIAFGQAILFHAGASSGGLDVVAKIVSKYTSLDIGVAVTISGVVVASSSLLIYDLGTFFVSVLATYLHGQVIDYFIDGFNKKKRICIVSDEYEKIRQYVLHDLNRGISLYKMIGGYDNVERIELETIMTTYEYKHLINFIRMEHIHAFITVGTVNEVIGVWNQKKK